MFFKLLFSASIIICQCDRFLALYLNAEYNNYFNVGFSLKICALRYCYATTLQQETLYTVYLCFSATVCLVISILTSAIDPDIFKCEPSIQYLLTTHKINIYYSALPKGVAAISVITVSLYVRFVMKRISNDVLPANLPAPQVLERCFTFNESFYSHNFIFLVLEARDNFQN